MASTGGWQTQVGVVPAPAVEGDFASNNPYFTVDIGPGGFVTGNAGVTIGRFAWASSQAMDPDNSPIIVNSFGSGAPTGFVRREQQGLITTFLADASMVIPQGMPVTLYSGGDFWVKNNGTTQALIGQKAYANLANGSVSFAATGSAGSASITGSIAAASAQFTASLSGNTLTVTSLAAGTIIPGSALTGTGGGGVAANTFISAQLSGTIGGVGLYSVNIGEQTVTSGTFFNALYGILTVTAVSSGTIVNGGLLTTSGGTAIIASTVLIGFGTGAGGSGTYYVNNNQTVSSETMSVTTSVETKFIAMSSGNAGELVKISDHALG